jgi:hypothetical protein
VFQNIIVPQSQSKLYLLDFFVCRGSDFSRRPLHPRHEAEGDLPGQLPGGGSEERAPQSLRFRRKYVPVSLETSHSLHFCGQCLYQGCQMVSFQTKNINLGKFWRAIDWKMFMYFMAIWNILQTFWIFYDHLVHFMFIFGPFFRFWYHMPRKIWQPWPLFLFSTHKQCSLILVFITALLWFPQKPYTLAGFEPGSSVPEADAVSTAPCRQGKNLILWRLT